MLTRVDRDDLHPALEAWARERARKGATFLDEKVPGWAHKIEKQINISSTHECVLAQLFGRYKTGLKALGIDDEQALRLGFRGDRVELRNSMTAFAHYYKELSSAWEDERKMRLG